MTVTIGGPTPPKICGTCGAVGEYPGFGGRPCPKCLAAEEATAMKRSAPLARSTPLRATTALQRRSPLRSRPRRRPLEPGEAEWKRIRCGWCEVCGHFAWILHHHHVYPEALIRREGGWPWNPDNGMFVCALCHLRQHSASHRIPLAKVPDIALAYAVDLIGEHRSADFFHRRYGA